MLLECIPVFIYAVVFTVRNVVINIFTSVCHSVHGGCVSQHALGQTPPGQTSPWADTPLHQTVCILLECFLLVFVVTAEYDNPAVKS